MPAIDPFNIAPLQGLNRLQAYWYCLLMKAGYRTDPTFMRQLTEAAGGVSAQRFDRVTSGVPSTWICAWADGSVVVNVNGTTAWPQYLLTYVGASLQFTTGSNGRINSFVSLAALDVEAAIRSTLVLFNPPHRVYSGHSLGGAIAALLGERGQPPGPVDGVLTAGQPRVGNLTWATAFNRPYQRLTNTGDPVPFLPPSTNTFLDGNFLPTLNPAPLGYRHAGFRYHLCPDSSVLVPPEMSIIEETAAQLIAVTQGNTGWVGAHDAIVYACRCRGGIPVGWKQASADYPGIEKLDDIFEQLNDGQPCALAPAPVPDQPQPPVPDGWQAIEGRCQ